MVPSNPQNMLMNYNDHRSLQLLFELILIQGVTELKETARGEFDVQTATLQRGHMTAEVHIKMFVCVICA